jgi:hypothetical protein
MLIPLLMKLWENTAGNDASLIILRGEIPHLNEDFTSILERQSLVKTVM